MIAFPEMTPRDATPMWEQVAAVLRDAITSGELAPGQVMPSETDLIGMSGAGRQTVRRAIAALREEGLAVTIPKRGTYVTPASRAGDGHVSPS
jgi:GntR family transcriptional regulator